MTYCSSIIKGRTVANRPICIFSYYQATRLGHVPAIISGVEVAGLLLDAISLIIEAFYHWGRAYDAFATHQKYPRETMKTDSKLGAQKRIFRNSCINLLAS